MTEQEEFEFRSRYEKEKSAPEVSPIKAGGKAAFESLGGAGGALAGGEAGAALGTMVAPGLGTIVGGLGGTICPGTSFGSEIILMYSIGTS